MTQIDGDNWLLLLKLEQEIAQQAAAPAAWRPKSKPATASASTAPAVAAAPAPLDTPAEPSEKGPSDSEVDYGGDEEEEPSPAIPRNEPQKDDTTPTLPSADEVRRMQEEIITMPTPEEVEQRDLQENSEWASPRVVTSQREPAAAPAASAVPAASAAPAVSSAPAALRRDRQDGRIAYYEASGHLSFMSWNAGGGARKLADVLDEVGNHIVAIQEAHIEQLQAPFLGRRHPSSAGPAAPASLASCPYLVSDYTA